MSKNYYFWSLVATFVNASLIAISYLSLPQQVPLWFTYPWGESQLAPKIWLVILPFAGIIVIGMNQLTTRLLPDKSQLMTTMLSISSLLFNVMLLVSIIGIVQSLL